MDLWCKDQSQNQQIEERFGLWFGFNWGFSSFFYFSFICSLFICSLFIYLDGNSWIGVVVRGAEKSYNWGIGRE